MRGLDRFDPAGLHARASGRSWWALRYTDGRLIHERERDWSHCPPKGRQRLRLYCPNGEVAELGCSGDETGRLFQFKVALRRATPPAGTAQHSALLAHVIGRLDGPDGRCTLYAWEPGSGRAQPELRAWLAACAARHGGYTALAAYARLPLPALAAAVKSGASLPATTLARLVAACGAERSAIAPTGLAAETARRWAGLPQLAGPISDNAHALAYHQLGALCPDHLGIAAP